MADYYDIQGPPIILAYRINNHGRSLHSVIAMDDSHGGLTMIPSRDVPELIRLSVAMFRTRLDARLRHEEG